MQMDDVLFLTKAERYQDEYGSWDKTTTQKRTFCRIESIDRREFFEGGRNGIRPVMKFIIFGADYEGEEQLTYRDQEYAIYRTYQIPGSDYMELYVQERGGVHDESHD